MPSGAIAASKGPAQEADVRRWILGYAILAPHSHNLQSWLVDLSVPDEIMLRYAADRIISGLLCPDSRTHRHPAPRFCKPVEDSAGSDGCPHASLDGRL